MITRTKQYEMQVQKGLIKTQCKQSTFLKFDQQGKNFLLENESYVPYVSKYELESLQSDLFKKS